MASCRLMKRAFSQVDVFADAPFMGNPVAVILDGTGLSDREMQQFANWTNLSETTFVLPAESALADYRVRIFTPALEVAFAGHPTLGTCHAWLEAGGVPRQAGVVVQECGVGLVRIRRGDDGLAFAAPPRIRSGPPEPALVARAAEQLRIDPAAIREAEWLDNGIPWLGVVLGSVDEVLALQPGVVEDDIGVIAFAPAGSETALEIRAFFPHNGATAEDPITGGLNAAIADWLIEAGRITTPYVAAQGTVLNRHGRVRVDRDADGTWIGGGTVTCVQGTVEI